MRKKWAQNRSNFTWADAAIVDFYERAVFGCKQREIAAHLSEWLGVRIPQPTFVSWLHRVHKMPPKVASGMLQLAPIWTDNRGILFRAIKNGQKLGKLVSDDVTVEEAIDVLICRGHSLNTKFV